MIAIRKLHTRVLILFVFIGACVRMAVAQIWPLRNLAGTLPKRAEPSDVSRGLLLRLGGTQTDQRHYGLEITGIFPFVRVISAANPIVRMPLENAALSGLMAAEAFDLRALTSSVLLSTSSGTSPSGEFVTNNCASCISCGSCVACSSCLSCSACSNCSACSGCSCGCSGCGGCSSCSSCASCFFCSSCFY